LNQAPLTIRMNSILIADQNRESAKYLAGILESYHYHNVTCIHTAGDLLDYINDPEIDLHLAIIDRPMMETKNGTVLKKKLCDEREIPFIVINQESTESSAERLNADPAIIPLHKPFKPEEVLLKVAAMLYENNGHEQLAMTETGSEISPPSPALIITDKELIIQHIIGEPEKLFGADTDKHQCIGSSLDSLLSLDTDKKDLEALKNELAANPDKNIETSGVILSANGSPDKPVRLTISRILSEDGTPSFTFIFQPQQQILFENNSSRLLLEAFQQNMCGVLLTNANLEKPGPEIIYCNDTFCKMTGYEKSEIIGNTPRIFQGPKTDRHTLDELKQTLKKGYPYETQTHNYRKDGTEYIVRWIISPIKDHKNKTIYYVSFQQDVTRQVKTDQQLQKSEARFRQIAQHITPFFYIRSCETGAYTYMSPSFERITGHKAEELYDDQLALKNFVHTEDRKEFKDFHHCELETAMSEIQFRIVRPDGEVRHIKMTTEQVPGHGDQPCQIIGTGDDITREVLETTEKSELGRIIKSSESELYVVDRDTLQFKMVSQGALKNMGYTEDELLTMTPIDISDLDQRENLLDKLYDTGFGTKESVSFEVQHCRKDGTCYDALVKVNVSHFHNKPVYVASVTDISNQKRIEQELLENKNRLQRAQQIGRIGDWSYKPDSETFYWSDQIFALYGLDKATDNNPNLFKSVLNTKRNGYFKKQLESAIKSNKSFGLDHKYTGINGEIRYFHIVGFPQKDTNNEITKIEGTVQDITERKKAELKARKQAEFLETTTSYIPGVVYQFKRDKKGNYSLEYMSRGLHDFLPCSTEEVCEDFNTLWNYLHPDDIPKIEEKIEQSYDMKTLFGAEFRYIDDQEQTRWLQAQSTPYEMGNGDMVWYGYLQDITNRKKEELQFRMLAEMSEDIISVHDTDLSLRYVNPRADKVFDGEQRLEIGGNPLDITHRDDIPKMKEALQKNLVGESSTFEWRRLLDNGKPVWIESKSRPIPGPTGKTEQILCSSRIIDERKKKELFLLKNKNLLENIVHKRTRKLQSSEILHSKLFESMNQGIIYFDKKGKAIRMNKAAEEILGISDKEIKNSAFDEEWIEIYTGDNTSIPAKPSFIREALEGTQALQNEIIGIHNKKKDFVKWVEISVTALPSELDHAATVYCTLNDITNMVNTQKKLRKARNEAEKMAKIKQEFLAKMSHEIRTPISGIRGMIHLLRDAVKGEEEQSYLQAIKHSSDALLTIVNDILDTSKMERGLLKINHNPFRLNDVIDSIESTFREKIMKSGLEFEISIESGIPDVLVGDRSRLYQILVNLIGNAFKFTHDGFIKIDISLQKQADNKAFINFKVADSGIGIESSQKEEIFELFAQENRTISQMYGGTGLGLAITKKLVELMDGKITLESEQGKGSTFTISLPFDISRKVDLPDPENDPAESGSLDNLSVLIVDDNPINIKWTAKLVEKWGADTYSAEEGFEALEVLRDNHIDIVLMDIQMPGYSGLEVTKFVRNNIDPPQNEVPIIGVSADVIGNQQEQCQDAGMNAYISKPFEPADLLKIIIENISSAGEHQQNEPDCDNSLPELTTISTKQIDELAENDTSFKLEIVVNILDLLNETIYQMDQELKNENIESIGKLAHTIKSNCRYLDMEAFDYARAINERAKTDTITLKEISKLVHQFKESANQSKDEIEALIKHYKSKL